MKLKVPNVFNFFKRLWKELFGDQPDDELEWFEDYPAGANRIPEDIWKKYEGRIYIKEHK